MKLYHLNILATKADRDELNLKGWDGDPRFTRHADITMSGDLEQAAQAWELGEYELVAHIDGTMSLDDVFMLTQNHTQDGWYLDAQRGSYKINGANRPITVNPKPLSTAQRRSTSVGDVVVHDGQAYICASFGWEALTVEVAA